MTRIPGCMTLIRVKFKVIYIVILFSVFNVYFYQYFAYPEHHPFGLNWDREPDPSVLDKSHLRRREARFAGFTFGHDRLLFRGLQARTVGRGDKREDVDLSYTSNAQIEAASAISPNETLNPCPLIPPFLKGAMKEHNQVLEFDQIAESSPLLEPGGRYKPPDCIARHRVAIIIPYRNRERHLKVLLHDLHPMLQRQQLDYGIFVIDQEKPTKFNRAMLMNIGFVEAMKRYDYQCAVFHDVDLIPENDKNIYSCPQMPRHLSASIDKFDYRLPYPGIYGGASAVRKEHMLKVNGFSNMFYGWGGEDDDMSVRIRSKDFRITRYPMEVARYRMIEHDHDEMGNEDNPERYALLKLGYIKDRINRDGLVSLQYQVNKVTVMPTHLHLLVSLEQPHDNVTKEAFTSDFS